MFQNWTMVITAYFGKFTKNHLVLQLNRVNLWSANYNSIKLFKMPVRGAKMPTRGRKAGLRKRGTPSRADLSRGQKN